MTDLRTRFQQFFAVAEPGGGALVGSCEPIPGGYSRISACAQPVVIGCGRIFILRGDPPAGSGVFTCDRDDEWRLLQALQSLPTIA